MTLARLSQERFGSSSLRLENSVTRDGLFNSKLQYQHTHIHPSIHWCIFVTFLSEIAELMSVKSKHGAGGEYAPEWRPKVHNDSLILIYPLYLGEYSRGSLYSRRNPRLNLHRHLQWKDPLHLPDPRGGQYTSGPKGRNER
jgi:hypothetical protein